MNPKKAVVAGVLAAAMTITPAVGSASAAPARSAGVAQQADQSQYDARTVFRGLFLGHGPVAAKFPGRFVQAPRLTPQVAKVENLLMDQYQKAYPGSMEALQRAIASGSHTQVREQLATNHTQLRQLLVQNARKAGLATPQAGTADRQLNITKFVAVVIAAAGAVAVAALNVAAAANVAWKWNWVWSSAQDARDTGSALERDQFVVDVVNELR